MGRAIFRASVRGARRPGYRLAHSGRVLQRTLLDQMGLRLAPTATRIYREFAPHQSGRLERGLNASVRSGGGRITTQVFSTAVSDEGYPYTDVTRFGHRVAYIYPKPPRKALRFAIAGGVIFARRVRGYHPDHDWAESAGDAVDVEISAMEDEIGRQIVSRLL